MDAISNQFIIKTVPKPKERREGNDFYYDDEDKLFFDYVFEWHSSKTELDCNLVYRSKRELLQICIEGEIFVVIASDSKKLMAAAYVEFDVESEEWIFGGVVVDRELNKLLNSPPISTALISYMVAHLAISEEVIIEESASEIVAFVKKNNKLPLRLLKEFEFRKRTKFEKKQDENIDKYGSTRLDTLEITIKLLFTT